jgi:hypothetical protein
MAGIKLLNCRGGSIHLPDATLVLVDRVDGGNLIVNPPRDIWERSELTPDELTQWSFLVAATGKAMLDALPQLEGGCINYWEAGNWSLNERAEPFGPKTARERRRVHLHLLGRSRTAKDPSWSWGEAPKFPDFTERYSWASKFERLSAAECRGVVVRVEALLKEQYLLDADHITPWTTCEGCGYPTPSENHGQAQGACIECRQATR